MFRVVLACAVLLLCLFAAVWVLSRHYIHEVIQEMEQHAVEVAERVQTQVLAGRSLDDVEVPRMVGEEIRIVRWTGGDIPEGFGYDISREGRILREYRKVMVVGGEPLLFTSSMEITPQSEIIRAFQKPYMLAVIFVFLVTLGLMVYFIVRTLRPLTDLSDTCAQITEGHLKSVRVRNTTGEVRALEQTFNRMVEALQEKELVEANLRRAQRLSALGNLAAGVAHDVRNPLNAIKLLSSHALDTLANAPDADRATKHLQTIREEVDRIDEIVTRFLSLAKDRHLEPEPVKVDALLQECLDLLQKDAEKRDVRLLSDLRAGDTTLMLDREQWRRAVLNVLINALEACAPEGRVRLFSRVTDSTCEIEVRDDGSGMSAEVLERAFEPYFTTKSTGTGLGLSITRGIVEEHGGRIALSCVPDRGCQVLVTMPLEGKKL